MRTGQEPGRRILRPPLDVFVHTGPFEGRSGRTPGGCSRGRAGPVVAPASGGPLATFVDDGATGYLVRRATRTRLVGAVAQMLAGDRRCAAGSALAGGAGRRVLGRTRTWSGAFTEDFSLITRAVMERRTRLPGPAGPGVRGAV